MKSGSTAPKTRTRYFPVERGVRAVLAGNSLGWFVGTYVAFALAVLLAGAQCRNDTGAARQRTSLRVINHDIVGLHNHTYFVTVCLHFSYLNKICIKIKFVKNPSEMR
jgi:hypothetical protein